MSSLPSFFTNPCSAHSPVPTSAGLEVSLFFAWPFVQHRPGSGMWMWARTLLLWEVHPLVLLGTEPFPFFWASGFPNRARSCHCYGPTFRVSNTVTLFAWAT